MRRCIPDRSKSPAHGGTRLLHHPRPENVHQTRMRRGGGATPADLSLLRSAPEPMAGSAASSRSSELLTTELISSGDNRRTVVSRMTAPAHPGQAYGTMPKRRGYANKDPTTAMEPSSTSTTLPWMSRSEYVSTLPLWRRCLAMLNWRPVYDIEQETMRLNEINSKLYALLQDSDSSLPTTHETDSYSTNQ